MEKAGPRDAGGCRWRAEEAKERKGLEGREGVGRCVWWEEGRRERRREVLWPGPGPGMGAARRVAAAVGLRWDELGVAVVVGGMLPEGLVAWGVGCMGWGRGVPELCPRVWTAAAGGRCRTRKAERLELELELAELQQVEADVAWKLWVAWEGAGSCAWVQQSCCPERWDKRRAKARASGRAAACAPRPCSAVKSADAAMSRSSACGELQ